MSATRPAAVLVLAAGEGKRMKSRLPKVLHEMNGRSLLGHAVHAARGLAPEHLAVVVGHGRDQVSAHLESIDADIRPIVQQEQNGTGHAVRTALAELPSLSGTVVVTYGDVPLLPVETLQRLIAGHHADGAAATVLTASVPDPTGYGRVLRSPAGAVTGIVEHKDATPEQQRIVEINSGIYAFDADALREALGRVKTDNAQGEEYLTDVVGILAADGAVVRAVNTDDYHDILGVNDRRQLAGLRRILNDRILDRHMSAGVTVVDPQTTWVDDTVELEPDVTLQPNTTLQGTTTVAVGAEVGPDTTLSDTAVGADARVVRTHGEGARVGAQAAVGPFAYLRPGTVLGADGKIGTFVETKQAEIGAGSKVPHLSYVGDATIGERTNIGASTIFVNYDGVAKHHTTVGNDCRTGSDNTFVAPVTINDGAYTGAGAVIRRNVPSGALAVSGGPQRNLEGWVERKRRGTRAEAAARAAAEETSSGAVGAEGTNGPDATAGAGDPGATKGATGPAGPTGPAGTAGHEGTGTDAG